MLIGKTVPLAGPELRRKLGAPSTTRDNKMDWYWMVELPSGAKLEIYNYKDGPTYGANWGFEAPRCWHIGLLPTGRTGRAITFREQSFLLEELQSLLGKGACTYLPTAEELRRMRDFPF